MTHDEFQDLLAPAALGTLPAAERAALDGHLPSCDDCRRTLSLFRAAAPALALSAPAESPPSRVKSAVMAATGRRPSRLPALALAASVLAMVLGGLFAARRQASPLEILAVSGAAQVDGRAVLPGQRVRAGLLTTGEGAVLDVRLASRVVFRLKAGAEALVARERKGFSVDLRRGGILNVVKPGTPYSVRTPVASAAVRGTVFYVEAPAPGSAYLCLCRGHLHLEGPGLSQEVETDHHTGVALADKNGKTESAAAGMLGHTDEEISQLTSQLP